MGTLRVCLFCGGEWKFASERGTLRIDTIGSTFDTMLAVYLGSNFPSFWLRAASDDDAGSQSAVEIQPDPFVPLQIAVSGYATNVGDIVLNLNFTPYNSGVRPANDDFATRQILDGVAAIASGSTLYATSENGEGMLRTARSPQRSVWYSWIAPLTGELYAGVFRTDQFLDYAVSVFTGSAVTNLVSMKHFGVLGSLQVEAGTEYVFHIDAWDRHGNFEFFLRMPEFINASIIETTRILSDGSVQLEVTGDRVAGIDVVILKSENLQIWTPISTNTVPSSGIVTIPASAGDKNFYRLAY